MYSRVYVEITNICNRNCSFCPGTLRPLRRMSLAEFDTVTHCAPLMHKALGTVAQGAVRFSFSHFNTIEEINTAVSALRELAQEE